MARQTEKRGLMIPMRHLWVVEIQDKDQWFPTTGASLTRKDGLADLADWQVNNPHDKYRLRKYVPAN
jgi:hypothetical protein